jgi:hypothetical protein
VLLCTPTGHEVDALPDTSVYRLEAGKLERGERVAR